jgi:hypothetical protein
VSIAGTAVTPRHLIAVAGAQTKEKAGGFGIPMTVTAGLHHLMRTIQPSRAYDATLIAASWVMGSCITSDFLDYWLRRFWRSRGVAQFWSQLHARIWPFSL